MKLELDEQLCQKYPKIFANRHADMKTTCMCWGFECGDGWYNLLDHLCNSIQHHIDWSIRQNEMDLKYNSMVEDLKAGKDSSFREYTKGLYETVAEDRKKEILKNGLRKVKDSIPQVVADQVKEKFGTLRFYYHGGDDQIRGMVSLAESLSASMCEGCGIPSKVQNDGGWYSNICPVCRDLREQERVQMMKSNGFEE
jgi:hypothetical protein